MTHALVPNHNGDPSCACGYEPTNERTQMDACRAVREHTRTSADQPQCPCETKGQTTAACPTHATADTDAPPHPRGWE